MKLFQNARYYKWRRQKKIQKKLETILKRRAFNKIRAYDHHIHPKHNKNMIIEKNKKLMEDKFYALGLKVPFTIMMWIEDNDY